jgi:type IV pilus assembly protein PilO
MALKLDVRNLSPVAKGAIVIVPSVVLGLVMVFLLIMPKQKEIKALDVRIDEQNNQIAISQAKGAKLSILVRENERLLERLNELKQQLPDEKEISSLLKQVSDLCIASGLDMKSWKPGPKKTNPGGIVYEIPVSVVVTGTYHDFGRFLGSLTRLNRIVNINDIRMEKPQVKRGRAQLNISFTASTFSAIPDEELAKEKKGGRKK